MEKEKEKKSTKQVGWLYLGSQTWNPSPWPPLSQPYEPCGRCKSGVQRSPRLTDCTRRLTQGVSYKLVEMEQLSLYILTEVEHPHYEFLQFRTFVFLRAILKPSINLTTPLGPVDCILFKCFLGDRESNINTMHERYMWYGKVKRNKRMMSKIIHTFIEKIDYLEWTHREYNYAITTTMIGVRSPASFSLIPRVNARHVTAGDGEVGCRAILCCHVSRVWWGKKGERIITHHDMYDL